ncbi:MAG: hypothetical protein WD738_15615 [Pirellulales bacterium]
MSNLEFSTRSYFACRLGVGALVSCLVVLAGCGGREVYQVSGRAQYKDGSPITGGVRVIRLEPAEDTTAEIRKAASANIAPDGTFEMFTRRPGDGVIPGRYAVVFTVLDKAMGGRSLIPAKFTQGNTTLFELVVDENKEDLLFELEKL